MKVGTHSTTHSQLLYWMEASDKIYALFTVTKGKNFTSNHWKINRMGPKFSKLRGE